MAQTQRHNVLEVALPLNRSFIVALIFGSFFAQFLIPSFAYVLPSLSLFLVLFLSNGGVL
jgi:hypothetical protein